MFFAPAQVIQTRGCCTEGWFSFTLLRESALIFRFSNYAIIRHDRYNSIITESGCISLRKHELKPLFIFQKQYEIWKMNFTGVLIEPNSGNMRVAQ